MSDLDPDFPLVSALSDAEALYIATVAINRHRRNPKSTSMSSERRREVIEVCQRAALYTHAAWSPELTRAALKALDKASVPLTDSQKLALINAKATTPLMAYLVLGSSIGVAFNEVADILAAVAAEYQVPNPPTTEEVQITAEGGGNTADVETGDATEPVE